MNIYKMELRRGLKALLIWTFTTGFTLSLIIAMYPAMMRSDFMDMMNAKIAMLPKELVDMFHVSGQDIRQLPQYFANMYQFVLMAQCIWGALLGASALSREESEGTIEFLFAKPVTRARIAVMKLAAVCTQYLVFFVVVGLAGMAICIIVRPADLPLADLIQQSETVLLGGMIAGYAYLFLGFALSAFLQSARNAGSLAVGLFFGTYIMGFISALGVVPFLIWVSPINWFVPRDVIMNGISGLKVFFCFILYAACTATAFSAYRRKDFLA